jgi:hypothetical protein
MASTAPSPSLPRSTRRASKAVGDTLRRKALEKLTLAIAKAVESASDDTLADIIGANDLRHALAIAPRDIAPASTADLEAIKSAREKTARFREEMAVRAGGMYDRAEVAAMLGVSPAAIEKQRQRRQILGVPYGNEIRYPASQFVKGAAVSGLKRVLEAFGDMDPWEQLMLLTTPVEGYGEGSVTIFDVLARGPAPDELRQINALVSAWSA